MLGVTEKGTSAGIEIPVVIKELLRKRGLADSVVAEAFLNPDYQALGDPMLLADMDKAVTRILAAAKAGEKVAIYGDYDIDGISSTALLLEVLSWHGLEAVTYIPDRYKEGYGLHASALKKLKRKGVKLVVAVDSGITSIAEADWARQNDLDLIICDHHELLEELPRAVAVINPKRPDDAYPFKDLAGVGVAFALARALQAKTGIPEVGREKWLLDLVAMGTVCDVMPLVGVKSL